MNSKNTDHATAQTKSCHTLPFTWPDKRLKIVLVHPEIPPNTGNIARLCAGTDTELHLIEPLGFKLTDSAIKRAGLDYWEYVDIYRHKNFDCFLSEAKPERMYFLSTRGKQLYTDIRFSPGDALIFGCETKGLPSDLLEKYREDLISIPLKTHNVRSLNLANSASVVLYEALRQLNLSCGG